MINPIAQTMGITNNIRAVKSLMTMVKSAKDPNAMLQYMASQNPQLKSVMDMASSGKSPRDLFYEKAQEMGVDPEDILRQLR